MVTIWSGMTCPFDTCEVCTLAHCAAERNIGSE
jgi:hypothetical protein